MPGSINYFFQLNKKTLISSTYQSNGLFHNEYLSDIYDNFNNYSGVAYIVQTIIKSNNNKLSSVSTINATLYLLVENKEEIITLNFAHPDITGQNIDFNNRLLIDAIILSNHTSSINNNNLDKVIFKQQSTSLMNYADAIALDPAGTTTVVAAYSTAPASSIAGVMVEPGTVYMAAS